MRGNRTAAAIAQYCQRVRRRCNTQSGVRCTKQNTKHLQKMNTAREGVSQLPIVGQAEISKQRQRRAVSYPRQLAIIQKQLAQTAHEHPRRRRFSHLRMKQHHSLQQRAGGKTIAAADVAAAHVDRPQVRQRRQAQETAHGIAAAVEVDELGALRQE